MLESKCACEVCFSDYDTKKCVPHLIPGCGHTFCKVCVSTILDNDGYFKCPKCKQTTDKSCIKEYPKNFELLKMLEKNEQKSADTCPKHGKRLKHFDLNNKELLCTYCAFDKKVTSANLANEEKFSSLLKPKITMAKELIGRMDNFKKDVEKSIDNKRLQLIKESEEYFERLVGKLNIKKHKKSSEINKYFDTTKAQILNKFEEAIKTSSQCKDFQEWISQMNKSINGWIHNRSNVAGFSIYKEDIFSKMDLYKKAEASLPFEVLKKELAYTKLTPNRELFTEIENAIDFIRPTSMFHNVTQSKQAKIQMEKFEKSLNEYNKVQEEMKKKRSKPASKTMYTIPEREFGYQQSPLFTADANVKSIFAQQREFFNQKPAATTILKKSVENPDLFKNLLNKDKETTTDATTNNSSNPFLPGNKFTMEQRTFNLFKSEQSQPEAKVAENKIKELDDNKFQIFVKWEDMDKTVAVNANLESCVRELKAELNKKFSLAESQQMLMAGTHCLNDTNKLCDYGIQGNQTIFLKTFSSRV